MRLIISLFILLLPLATLATSTSARFNRLSLSEGLSQTVVHSIIEDQQGFLWFATEDGLNRYDGYSFKVFRHDPQDPGSLSNNWIQAIYQDGQGSLWIGTQAGGLNRYNRQTQQFERYQYQPDKPYSLSHNNVSSIVEDDKGILWIGTQNGLNRYNRQTRRFNHFKHKPQDPHSLSDNRVQSIYQDNQGILWVGTFAGGLNQYDRQSKKFTAFKHHPNSNSLSHNNVKAIYQDNQGILWLGTDGGGLNRFDPQSQKFSHYRHQPNNPSSLSSDDIWAIQGDEAGILWIGTQGGGVNRFNPQGRHFDSLTHDITDPHSLSNNNAVSIYLDSKGSLWLGTYDGINKLDVLSQHFRHIQNRPNNPGSLSDNRVRSFHQDSHGDLWVGTDNGGLNQYQPQTANFKHYTHDINRPNSLGKGIIWAINEDSNGTLWVGTDSGLNSFNRQTGDFTHYPHHSDKPNSMGKGPVRTIFQDNEGTLWIGTYGSGLSRLNTNASNTSTSTTTNTATNTTTNTANITQQSFEHLRHQPDNADSLSDDHIRVIYQDSQNTLWIGTYNGGLNRYQPETGTFSHFTHNPSDPKSLSHNRVMAIHQDRQGTLWIGTYGGGLNRYNAQSGQFSHFREKDGLPNDVVYSILEDETGKLWLTTNKGLAQFNPQSGKFRHFDVNDGLQSNEFNQGAWFKSADGELFIGGVNGFNRFYPQQISHNNQPPALVLSDFLLFNQTVEIEHGQTQTADYRLPQAIDQLDTLTLTHQQSLISFEFAALQTTNPMKRRYAYKLQGWDQDWVITDAKYRRATYTRLDPGHYTFEVKVSSHADGWHQQAKTLALVILPPPWQSWWAYLLYAVICIALLSLAFYLLNQRNIKHNLKRMVAERTAALEQKNHEIVAAQQQLVQTEKLASLGTLTAGVAHEINNPTSFVAVSTQNLEVDLNLCQQFIFDLAGDDADEDILNSFRQKFAPLHQHVATIKDGTERIKMIVKDLRAFSKLEADNKKTVKITELLQSTLNLIQTKYLEIAEFTTDFEDHPMLECYPAQLNQVFMNLVVNACDAIRERQTEQKAQDISPVMGQVVIGCKFYRDVVEISVRDNGSGMTEQTKEKLFEPFYTTKGSGEGTGLGLSISSGIVQKHGGELLVESELGFGTIFMVRLPA